MDLVFQGIWGERATGNSSLDLIFAAAVFHARRGQIEWTYRTYGWGEPP